MIELKTTYSIFEVVLNGMSFLNYIHLSLSIYFKAVFMFTFSEFSWFIVRGTVLNTTFLISLIFPLFIAIPYNLLKLKLFKNDTNAHNKDSIPWVSEIINKENFDAILDHIIQINISLLVVLYFLFSSVIGILYKFKKHSIEEIQNILFHDIYSIIFILVLIVGTITYTILFLKGRFHTSKIFEDYKRSSTDNKITPPTNIITFVRLIVVGVSIYYTWWIKYVGNV